MSLRPPSNVVAYDDFFSGDPAIIPLPDKPEERKERARLLAVARETGRWDDVVVPGRIPAKFKMQPLPGNTFREIRDAIERKSVGSNRAIQIAFRAAFLDVVDPELGEQKFKREDTERYGKIAAIEVADFFDKIDTSIVDELGGEALRRAHDLSPK